jgi:hypothetical protein
MNLKRSRYQQGSLTIEKRKNGPNVYVYRWREKSPTGSVKRKQVLGNVKDLTKTQAQRKADGYRKAADDPAPKIESMSLTVAELVEHYAERELCEASGKVAKVRKAYRSIFDNYILPKWGTLPLAAVKAVQVARSANKLSRIVRRTAPLRKDSNTQASAVNPVRKPRAGTNITLLSKQISAFLLLKLRSRNWPCILFEDDQISSFPR